MCLAMVCDCLSCKLVEWLQVRLLFLRKPVDYDVRAGLSRCVLEALGVGARRLTSLSQHKDNQVWQRLRQRTFVVLCRTVNTSSSYVAGEGSKSRVPLNGMRYCSVEPRSLPPQGDLW